MGIAELVLISLGLAMDAFSVSVCKGLSMKKLDWRGTIITSLFFGGFQFIMPVLGYFLGSRFEKFISAYSHWVAFILLAFIGGKMVIEALRDSGEESSTGEYRLDYQELTILAIATSIDALAVGIVFAAQKMQPWFPSVVIGVITLFVCMLGVAIGNRFGSKYETKAQVVGGSVLILIGVKLLLEGLGIL